LETFWKQIFGSHQKSPIELKRNSNRLFTTTKT
jgi:hypothetical protein